MIVSLSAQVFDTAGAVQVDADPTGGHQNLSRRVTRSQTLDGGCCIDDMGFSHADRTIDLTMRDLSEVAADTLKYLARTYALLTATMSGEAFTVTVDTLAFSGSTGRIKLLVKEKTSDD